MELLDEIWSLIFREHLDLLDMIRCRRVSKRFRFLIDQLRPSELFIYFICPNVNSTYRYERASAIWWQWRKQPFRLEVNSSFYIVFANLKILQLEMALYNEDSPLEVFNEFVKLEKLYLNDVVIARSETLKLPRLKTLSVRLKSADEHEREECGRIFPLNYDRQPRLVIDCKLEELLGARSNLLVLKHPECIHHLEIPALMPFRPGMKLEELALFPNLRTLHSPLTQAVLDAFQLFGHLEELHLDYNFPHRWRLFFPEKRETKIRFIKQLLEKNAELKRKTKIYFNHILITKFEERFFHEKFQIYHQGADCVRDKVRIEYYKLIHLLNDSDLAQTLSRNQIELDRGLPKDFFDRFPNIKNVCVKRTVENVEWFTWFLARCPRLIELLIKRQFLTQPLLNRLRVATKNLRSLHIYQGYRSSDGRLDLSPLYELKQLCSLYLQIDDADPDSQFDLGILLEKCRYLVETRLNQIEILLDRRTGLYKVFTHTGAHPDSTLNSYPFSPQFLNLRATFGKAELQSNLEVILQECRDFQEKQRADIKVLS